MTVSLKGDRNDSDGRFRLRRGNLQELRAANCKPLVIGGQQANPPFEIYIPVMQSGVSATAHVIFDNLDIDLDNDALTVNLSFSDTSFVATSPEPITLAALSGVLTLTAGFITSVLGGTTAIELDFAQAKPSLNFSPTSMTLITEGLQGTGVSSQMFKDLANNAISALVGQLGQQTIADVPTVHTWRERLGKSSHGR